MRTEARRERILTSAIGSVLPVDQMMDAGRGETNMSNCQFATTRPPMRRLLIVAALAIAGLSWDLWSKREVFAQLNCQGCPGFRHMWKGQLLGVSIRFQLETTFNHGALWGMGQGMTWLFASLSFVAVAAILYFLWNRQAIATLWLTVVTGLLLAGTLGNLFDRLGLHGWKDKNGHVVYGVRDFLDFYFFNDRFHWATFNFADSYLVIGACMLVLNTLWTPIDEQRPADSGTKP